MAKPVINNNGVGVVLNKKAGKTSRLYLKGQNFSAATTVAINGKACNGVKYDPPDKLIVKLKDPSRPAAPPTGEITVTITVANGAESSDTPVTVYVDDDDDVP